MATASCNPSNSLDERLFPLIQMLERPVAERPQHDTHTAPGIPEHKKRGWWHSSPPAAGWSFSGSPIMTLTNS